MPKKQNPLLFIIIFAGLLALPLFIKSNYILSILIIVGLYTVVVEGLGLFMGYAGQVSFGHAAFYGLGAYPAAILSTSCGWPPLLTLLVSIAVPALVAFIIGQPTLKLREQYLALATLGFGILVYIFFNEFTGLTGGPSGLVGIPYLTIGSIVFDQDIKFYYVAWTAAALTFLMADNLVNSRIGRALKAIRDSEIAAEAVGIDTAKLKLKIFILSAALAGLAGGLYAYYVTFVSPSPFGLNTSIQFVLMAVVGGLGTTAGPLFGAAAIIALTELLQWAIPAVLPRAGGEFEIVFFGLILVLVVLLRPEGIYTGPRTKIAVEQQGRSGSNC